jgi:phosphoribosylformimino-5-aminoimidazole carboxamide ribotide isomerase
VDEARRAVDRGATRVIVGLETLPSFAHLEAIRNAVGRVVFSLDLREGKPVVLAGGTIEAGASVETITRQAVDAGVDTMIAIDLARVGTGAGVDLVLIDRLRAHAPSAILIAGGGIRGWADLEQLAEAGCDGALVATALHAAHLTAADVARTLSFAPRL